MSQLLHTPRSRTRPSGFARGLGYVPLATCLLPALMTISATMPVPIEAQDEQAYEVLEEASEHYLHIKTLCAHFHQVIEITLLRESREGEGTICQLQPDKFSMRFSDPPRKLVSVGGR